MFELLLDNLEGLELELIKDGLCDDDDELEELKLELLLSAELMLKLLELLRLLTIWLELTELLMFWDELCAEDELEDAGLELTELLRLLELLLPFLIGII